MATVWSILATLAMIASAGSFVLGMYPARAGSGVIRSGALLGMVGFGILTVFALRLALGTP